ncbi:MAG: transposase, partial [Chloroflexia bacterium]|nr:transposase [Chloroflexia bacterium]
FGLRRDALWDLLDAVLTADRVTSLVRLSLAPAFRRRWPSLFDALTDGRLDDAALRRLWTRSLPPPAAGIRTLWAIAGSTWPRPEAKTSPDRTGPDPLPVRDGGHPRERDHARLGIPVAGGDSGSARELGPAPRRQPPQPQRGDAHRVGHRPAPDGPGRRRRGAGAPGGRLRQPLRCPRPRAGGPGG